MGFFSDLIRKKPPASEEVLKRMENLEPITINLSTQQFQCSNGHWRSVSEYPEATGRMQDEVLRLRKEKVALEREIIKYARQEQEMKQLKEKLNLMDLKYQVLVEMWTTKQLNAGGEPRYMDMDEDIPMRNGQIHTAREMVTPSP